MITPEFTVDVSSNKLAAHLEGFTPLLREKLLKTIASLTAELLARVRAAEPVRTGYLRSVTQSYVASNEDFIGGRVRIRPTGHASREGAAFGALEYGVPRQIVAVSAYARRGIAVRAYERTTQITARRFLRGSLDAMREKALAEIKAAMADTVATMNVSAGPPPI